MKRIIHLGLILIGTVFLYSCTQESQFDRTIDEEEVIKQYESHFVSLENALCIANLQKSTSTKGLSISDYLVYNKTGALAEFYIINYPNAGFIIISADDRLNPVLAFSENTHFPLGDSNVPYGVTDWLNSTSAFVDSIRNSDMKQDVIAKNNWESVLSGRKSYFSEGKCDNAITKGTDISTIVWEYGEDYDQDDCGYEGQVIAEYYIYVAPFLLTTWDQGDGFNESIPYGNCLTTLNGRYPVGCVPVAVGQLMVHNRYPSNFDWDSIYNNDAPYGTATNNFLRDLGLPANLNMSYSCNGSTTYLSNAVNYLKSVGYSKTTTTTSMNVEVILNNLRFEYPVMFVGGSGNNVHMWVCDGIMSYNSIVCYVSGACYDTRTEINMNWQFLHMNWGWDSNYDGFYSIWDFTPGSHDFDSDKIIIYNVRP